MLRPPALVNCRPIRLGVAAMAPFGPVIGVKRRLQVAVADGLRQVVSSAPAKRLNISRTVEADADADRHVAGPYV